MYRGRRLRKNQVIRSMMKETVLTKRDLIYPLFVMEGVNILKHCPGFIIIPLIVCVRLWMK